MASRRLRYIGLSVAPQATCNPGVPCNSETIRKLYPPLIFNFKNIGGVSVLANRHLQRKTNFITFFSIFQCLVLILVLILENECSVKMDV